MKIKQVVIEEADAAFVELDVAVRYDEEDMPLDFPGRSGETWRVFINLANGEMYLGDRNMPFPVDVTLDLQMKVCDDGTYRLLDGCGNAVGKPIEYNYVPDFFPGDHYGDYIILDIAGGKATNWKQPTAMEVEKAFRLRGGE